jgi:hypothetical protein
MALGKTRIARQETMTNLVKGEAKAFFSYVRDNWCYFLVYLGLGLFFVILVNIFGDSLKNVVPKIELGRIFIWLILFLWLILFSLWERAIKFWIKYRNSYFLTRPSFIWADAVIFFSLPVLFFVSTHTSLFDSIHFRYILFSLGFFFVGTYLGALINAARDVRGAREKLFVAEDSRFVADEPIKEPSQSLAARRLFVKSLKEHIYNFSFQESFVIGLYGRWGEGKSSVLNILKKECLEDDRVLVYEFNPWFFGSKAAIIENFYRGLEHLLSERYFIPQRTKNFFRFYPQVLISGFINLSLRPSDKESEDRPAELKRGLGEFIGHLRKHILVIIDDVDRLQKEEILEVFRLIKLTGHMKNMIFILSFDPALVASILEADSSESGRQLLETIIQLPIYLPAIGQREIDNLLLFSDPPAGRWSAIDQLLDRLGVSENKERVKKFKEEFTTTYQTNLKYLFSSLRLAKRYLNNLFFRLPFVKDEIYLYDFFIIEAFRTFSLKLYEDIKTNGWYYVSPWQPEVGVYLPSPFSRDIKYGEIKNHIENLLRDEENKKPLLSLLKTVFPAVKRAFLTDNSSAENDNDLRLAREYRIKQRAAHPDAFYRYFALGVKGGAIKDSVFEETVKLWREAKYPEGKIKSSFLKFQKESLLSELMRKLKTRADLIPSELVMPLARVIYQNSSKLDKGGDLWDNESNQARALLLRLIEDNEGVESSKIQKIFEEILRNVESLDFAIWLILALHKPSGGDLFRLYREINPDELEETVSARLKEHFVGGEADIFEEYPESEAGFILYQWATNWENPKETNRDLVTGYLTDLFHKKPRYAGYLLSDFIRTTSSARGEKTEFFDMELFEKAFDKAKIFKAIKDLGENAYLTENEKEHIDLFIKAVESPEAR